MDPALYELLDAGEGQDEVAVIVKLDRPGSFPEGVRTVAQFGRIVTARISRESIPSVRAEDSVASLKAPRSGLFPEPSVPAPDSADYDPNTETLPLSEVIKESDYRQPVDLLETGKGVVLGIIDWGFDFAHPEFINADGSTRLLAIWDQRSRPSSTVLEPYGYGIIHTREAINLALKEKNPYRALGYRPASGAHATHVASIAGGNGRAKGPTGVAPATDFVFVHLSNLGPKVSANLGDSAALLEAVDFIGNIAGDRPCVINASLGRHGEQHDGSTLVEQGLDAFVSERPGRAIVQSCGNYYNRNIHTSGRLRPGEKRDFIWQVDPADITPNELEVWYSGRDRLSVMLRSPADEVVITAELGDRLPIEYEGKPIGKLYHRPQEPNTQDNHIDIFLYPGGLQGDWEVVLTGEDIVDGSFHTWVERDSSLPGSQSRLAASDTVKTCTTGTICNGFRTVAVGAYNPHSDEQEMAPFSSSGPTRDGRSKPDLIAPGVSILGARSAEHVTDADADLLMRKSGTSMASPHVAGAIALMFEAAGRLLPIEETRYLLLTTTDPADGKASERVGSGYLNIERAVLASRRRSVQQEHTQENDMDMIFESDAESPYLAADKTDESEKPVASQSVETNYFDCPPERQQNFPQSLPQDFSQELQESSLLCEAVLAESEGLTHSDGCTHGDSEEDDLDIEDFEADDLSPSAPADKWMGGNYTETHSAGLVDLAERAITSVTPPSAESWLASLVSPESLIEGNEYLPTSFHPANIFDAFGPYGTAALRRYYEEFFEVVALPGESIAPSLEAGQLILRRAFGEGTMAHAAMVVSGELISKQELGHYGLQGETAATGSYAQVIEAGSLPHDRSQLFARRIADERGYLPNNQLVLQLKSSAAVNAPESGTESNTRPSTESNTEFSVLPLLSTVNLLTAGIEVALAIPAFNAPLRRRIILPLMSASENNAAIAWNRRKHPETSGITLEKLSVALSRYVDFESVESAINRYNQDNSASAIALENRPDNAVLAEAIHQFQLKCYIEEDQHDGLAGESVLDNLGLIERTGMQTVDKPYSSAQSRLNAKASQVEREAGGNITARNWFKNMVNPTFLGQRFTKGIHRVLIIKLREIEQSFLSQTPNTTPVELGERFGIVTNDKHRGMRFRGSGNHTFGIAFDLKYIGNPWIAGNPDRSTGNLYFEETMDRVTRLMVGEIGFSFTARYLHNLAQRLTTREIYAELSQRDRQLRDYLQLADNLVQLQLKLTERRSAGTTGIFTSDSETIDAGTRRWARQIQTDKRALTSYFAPGRNPQNGFLNISIELVEALRDRACMAWGAVDFGPNQSGDVMHFDLRVNGVGKVLSRHSPQVHPCVTSSGQETLENFSAEKFTHSRYGENVLHQCRPGEGPPAAVADPARRGLHPLVYRGTSQRRSRNPSVGDAQQLLNTFLLQTASELTICSVRTAEVQQFITRNRNVLKANNQVPLKVDCRFGPSTETATKMFQACKGLTRDGKIGPATWTQLARLRSASPVTPPVVPPVLPPGPISILTPSRWTPIIRRSISSASALRTGNGVKFLIDGADTFRAMVAAIRSAQKAGDYIYLLGWILQDGFEMIPGDASSTFLALATSAASRGVQVRAMLWDQVGRTNSNEVNRINRLAGGAAILDDETPNPVAAFGSHHQKVLVVKSDEGLVTFCGGVDINEDRIRTVAGGSVGSTGTAGSPMHDSHCQVVGPSARDLLETFIRRWDHHPRSARLDRTRGALLGRLEPVPSPISNPSRQISSTGGPCSVAIGRTFNPVTRGTRVPRERDILNLLVAGIRNAQRFIYVEDQYLIHPLAATELRAAVPRLQHLTILIAASEISDLPCKWNFRRSFIATLTRGLSASDRAKVRIFILVTPPSPPLTFGPHTYVHAKSWVFDDELAVIGSANCNRRGWNHDSEVNAFIFEDVNPVAPSQTFAQQYRAKLWAEHLNVSITAVADGVVSSRLWLSPPVGARIMPYNPTAGSDTTPVPDIGCRTAFDKIDPTIESDLIFV